MDWYPSSWTPGASLSSSWQIPPGTALSLGRDCFNPFNDTGHVMSCDTCGCGCSADSLITKIICCTYKLCSVIASVQACQISRKHYSFPDTLWHAARGAAWQNGWERAARKWLKATWRLLLKSGLLWASNITLTEQPPLPRL